MKTVIYGTGNVAYHLSKAISAAGTDVIISGRNEASLTQIAEELNLPFTVEIPQDADFYIFSVKDGAINEVSAKIKNPKALVVHTSGAVPYHALEGNFRKGVFYPLQTFSKTKALNYEAIPFFVEAENAADLKFLKDFALKISSKVMEADSEKRKYIHLTAVFAANFVNHLYARAKEISDSQEIPFNYFLPLIQETADKIHHLEPKEAQTGPARRNDQKVLDLHRELLNGEALEVYKTLNKSIKKMYEL